MYHIWSEKEPTALPQALQEYLFDDVRSYCCHIIYLAPRLPDEIESHFLMPRAWFDAILIMEYHKYIEHCTYSYLYSHISHRHQEE